MMNDFIGIVTAGYGQAAPNLAPVMALIEARTGLSRLVPGTLNVKIHEEYIVCPHALVNPYEYPLKNRKTNLATRSHTLGGGLLHLSDRKGSPSH
jgi:hypothetical protein